MLSWAGPAARVRVLNYVRVDGRLEAQAWCLGLGPVALLFGIGNLIYQGFAPQSHEPASTTQEPGMQDDKATSGRSGLV